MAERSAGLIVAGEESDEEEDDLPMPTMGMPISMLSTRSIMENEKVASPECTEKLVLNVLSPELQVVAVRLVVQQTELCA